MPLFREVRSRRAWRRDVADHLAERLDAEGHLRFVGSRPDDRREMLRIAELLPDDVIAELYEDINYPGLTFMELRFVQPPVRYDTGLRIVRPEERERAV